MKLSFRVDRGDEQDPDPIVLDGVGPSWKAAGVIRAVRFKLIERLRNRHYTIRIQVFLNEVRIQSQRTLGEQGVVDGSLLTVRWLWSEEQRKKTKCLNFEERIEAYKKRKDDIKHKREAFLREKGVTETELASVGFYPNFGIMDKGRKRLRSPSPSRGRPYYDTYMLYRSLTGTVITSMVFHDDTPEEVRIVDICNRAAGYLKCRPEQIKMQKELDVRSGECKIFVTVVPLELHVA